MMWIMHFFCHLVARLTSAWLHPPSNLCTYSIAKTTTMHDQSFFCHLLSNRKWVMYHFSITSNDNNSQPFCPLISHPPVTPNATQPNTEVSSASLQWCMHVSENTGGMIHEHSPEGLKKWLHIYYEVLKEDLGARGIFKYTVDVRCCHVFIKRFRKEPLV